MGKKKIIVNGCYGGFGLSQEAMKKGIELGWKCQEVIEEGWKDAKDEVEVWRIMEYVGIDDTFHQEYQLNSQFSFNHQWRANKILVEIVELLGGKANGRHADLKIVEIPNDVEWDIEEYDGIEWIAEKHQTWG